jgi:hypothetical protein
MSDPLRSLSKRVSAKLEEGDYRGAVRAACSNDTIAVLSPDTISALQQKHPHAHPDSTILSQLSIGEDATLQCSEKEVARAIQSFPNGSAGGPDGLRPQHLKDLIGAAAGNGGRDLLRALTAFVNFILQGHTPLSIRPSFFGTKLIALQKKEGGIRPIAVGLTLRRLVAKCASFHVRQFIGDKLAPLQLGFGTPLGCEAAVHAARIYLANCPTDHLLLKLDFSNAFNCLRRDKMLMAVKDSVPELYNFVFSAYGKPSHLFCGEYLLESAEGVQQGDPLGPLLFCLTIHTLVAQLRSEFRVFYLDDGSIGGSVEDVLHDFRVVEEVAADLGLSLNRKKTELICDEDTTCEAFLSEVPGLQVVCRSQASLLGSPIGNIDCLDSIIQQKVAQLQLLGERLNLLQVQDALLLLRHSFYSKADVFAPHIPMLSS